MQSEDRTGHNFSFKKSLALFLIPLQLLLCPITAKLTATYFSVIQKKTAEKSRTRGKAILTSDWSLLLFLSVITCLVCYFEAGNTETIGQKKWGSANRSLLLLLKHSAMRKEFVLLGYSRFGRMNAWSFIFNYHIIKQHTQQWNAFNWKQDWNTQLPSRFPGVKACQGVKMPI